MISLVVNEYRMADYVENVSEGFISLVSSNLIEKNENGQRVWLAGIERLSGLKMRLLKRSMVKLSLNESRKIAQFKPVIHSDVDQRVSQVYYAVPNDDQHLLSLDINDFNEQLARVASLLVQNELSRYDYDNKARRSVFLQLQKQFNYPVMLMSQDVLSLDATQSRLLRRGEMVISLNESSYSVPSIKVFSPTDVLDEVLVVGPVPIFDWTPQYFVLMHTLLGALLFGCCVYWILRPLQERLKRMGQEIEAVDLSQDLPPITVDGSDMLGLFALKVNAMAERIKTLMQSQRELTQAVSHELRTPIARMKFHLALMDELVSNSARKHLSGMQSDAQELERLVDEILSYANLEHQQPQLEISKADLAAQLRRLIIEINTVRPEIEFECDVNQVFICEADHHYLLRACQNLLVNAQRHAQKRVRVVLSQNNDEYCICVHDDGEGIADENKLDVFIPFKRLDSSRNRKSGGYGLGLAIVFEIMRWHSGSVKVYDSSLGGSEFRLQWHSDFKRNAQMRELAEAAK